MAKLMWCPNCEQKVSAQAAEKKNRGCAVVVLLVLSVIAAFFNIIIGGVVFLATIVYVVVGLVVELSEVGLSKPSCPICKADNLEPL